MAFCPNCGKELPNGIVCDCQNNNTFGNSAISKKKSNKKFLATGIVAVVAVTAFVLLASSLGGGYKKPVNDFIDGLNDGDFEDMISAVFPDDHIKTMKKDLKSSDFNWDDFMDEMNDGLEDAMEDLEDEYGKNVKCSVKFLEKKKVNGDDLDDIEEFYDDHYKAEVSKAYKVKTEITIKGKKNKDSNKSWLYVVKVKGDGWKISAHDDESGFTDMLGL